jgi:hypothetical protein
MEPHHPIVTALISLAILQVVQALGLIIFLLMGDRGARKAVAMAWRESLSAGVCGAFASAGWFIASALSPAAPVRASGVVEASETAFARRRFFDEKLHGIQI